jgi:uncharacterized membrane protein
MDRVAKLNSLLLLIGVWVAALLVACGGVIYLVHHGLDAPHYHTFTGAPTRLRTFSGIVSGALRLDGPSLIQFGLGVLVVLQLVRVGVSALLFRQQRDITYLVISLIVLLILLFGLFGGA